MKTLVDTEISKLERQRIVKMMKYLPTIQKRSYTNPFDSLYNTVAKKIMEKPKSHKEIVPEKKVKNIRMTEYQAVYEGKNVL
jgi:hypothetical protein